MHGCFLKGLYGGQLLAVVGKDANNQMFPIAYVVVEAETKESWMRFVELLVDDHNQVQQKMWAFISDQQNVCHFIKLFIKSFIKSSFMYSVVCLTCLVMCINF